MGKLQDTKSIVFFKSAECLHTCNKKIPIWSKRNKICTLKATQHHWKTSMKAWRNEKTCSWTGRLSIILMAILPKLIYKFNSILYQNSSKQFWYYIPTVTDKYTDRKLKAQKQIFGQLVFDKSAKTTQQGKQKSFQQKVLGKLDSHMKRMNLNLYLTLYTTMNLKLNNT